MKVEAIKKKEMVSVTKIGKKYTFKHQKNMYGTETIDCAKFSSPKGDGPEVRELMKNLPEKTWITITVEIMDGD